MAGSLLQPEERVLSTLNADGTRRWLEPMVSKGRLWVRRRIVAWLLIAIFVTLPHLHWDGKQLFFLNIAKGEFTLFGTTFLRTDTLLLSLSMMVVFVTIFLFTAMIGRVWCGWACPQTVYLEFVFRPIERLFNGKNKSKLGQTVNNLPKGVRRLLRYGITGLVCFVLANTFLSYFVGSRELLTWITSSPTVHPVGFGIVVAVTGAMIFDFCFFREQLCIVACPYGRFQSVMLDRGSMIVGYDRVRGEPRGKLRRSPKRRKDAPGEGATTPVDLTVNGDCVDCHKCVAVCPTGIDIRDGLQLECINCAQCIDACNGVMEKLGREPGLIRYGTQAVLEDGEPRKSLLRPRVVLYPTILVVLLSAITLLLITKSPVDAILTRGQGLPFNVLPSGEVANQGRLRLTNRTAEPREYRIVGDQAEFRLDGGVLRLEPGETKAARVLIVSDRAFFAGTTGQRRATATITDDTGYETAVRINLFGPVSGTAEPAPSTPVTPTEETP